MLIAPLLLAAGFPDLAALSLDTATRLDGRPVLVWVDARFTNIAAG